MGRPRIQLQQLLETLGATEVYFQPPNGKDMVYPCIVYELDEVDIRHADNAPYRNQKRYAITVIARDPDNTIHDRVALLSTSSFNRFFTADNLNHYVYNVYF